MKFWIGSLIENPAEIWLICLKSIVYLGRIDIITVPSLPTHNHSFFPFFFFLSFSEFYSSQCTNFSHILLDLFLCILFYGDTVWYRLKLVSYCSVLVCRNPIDIGYGEMYPVILLNSHINFSSFLLIPWNFFVDSCFK